MKKNLMAFGFSLLALGAQGQSESESEIINLTPRTDNGTKYLCGGVGATESVAMKRAALDYDLALTFAVSTGAYLADVDVKITDAQGGTVLQTRCDGPMLLVDVPKSGTYRVEAETGGYKLSRNAHIQDAGKRTAISITWPESAARMGGEPNTTPESSGK